MEGLAMLSPFPLKRLCKSYLFGSCCLATTVLRPFEGNNIHYDGESSWSERARPRHPSPCLQLHQRFPLSSKLPLDSGCATNRGSTR
jgi:hypothetical protein